ncbi:unnamed protein product [Toxocara canis]|uniref:Beta-lactamase domain-containing protein n=1 Tax=Toxocara canis TaxID=6265 RepID=A0A183UWE6_TOXCA|nr:unnamed protein product [Toxocara canis]
MWPPGTAVGYHATTFGWLVDQLVRRSDPNKRGLGQFYREEILPHMPGTVTFEAAVSVC